MPGVDLSALNTELLTDPTTLGYAGKQPGEVADLLNLKRAGITIDRKFVTASDLQSAVVGSEYVALTVAQQNGWNAILIAASDARGWGLPIDNLAIRAQVAAIWNAGTTTRANLLALQAVSPASRAEQLWGQDTRISFKDVIAAREI